VRADHPLRRVAAEIDFTFIHAEVAASYGHNGHVSVDPVILLKMMFLLFWDDVASERELMNVIPERLDYLWFLGYGLDDEIPNHSVLSKARARWGKETFEKFFVRTITQCVQAGLVDGRKLHVDSSLIDASASRDSVLRSSPELIAALKQSYQAQENQIGRQRHARLLPVGQRCAHEHNRSGRFQHAQRQRAGAPALSSSSRGGRRAWRYHRGRDDAGQHRGKQKADEFDRPAPSQHSHQSRNRRGRSQIRHG